MKIIEPSIGAEELNAVREVLESGFLTQGPKTAEFEKLVAAYSGSSFGHATSSATTGLHLALQVLGVGKGDEVILPDFSFPATANVVVQLGATPIFVDIALDTFNIDASKIEAKITSKTKAIMPVHAFGLCADMDPILSLAKRHGIPVLEDAACALGATYKGIGAGNLGAMGVFSFHPRKVITTGEGGMIVTDDSAISQQLAILRTHGAVRDELYLRFEECGFNYRLSDINSAIGVVQMSKLDSILQGRRTVALKYNSLLSGIPQLTIPAEPMNLRHSYQSYVVLLDENIDRNLVITNMRKAGIETTLGTYSMHLQPAFKKLYQLSDDDFPNATIAHHQCLTLPLSHRYIDDDLASVVTELKKAIQISTRISVL
jgi:dTDP-4-amino-4,6-dideoxygalactose transaminase